MFHDDSGKRATISKSMEGPTILKTEVEATTRKMNTGKSTGNDGIDKEMRNTLECFCIEVLNLLV